MTNKVCLLVILHHYNLWLFHLEINPCDGCSVTWCHSASVVDRWRHLSTCIIKAAYKPSDKGIDRPREDLFLCIHVVYQPKSYAKLSQTTILISVFELLNFCIAGIFLYHYVSLDTTRLLESLGCQGIALFWCRHKSWCLARIVTYCMSNCNIRALQ